MASIDVAIIDTGGANINSLVFAFDRLNVTAQLTRDADLIRAAPRVVLPGVGAAAASMKRLSETGLDQLIPHLTQPVLGICLGMQLLFEWSQEGSVKCLAIIPGTVEQMLSAPGLRIPHIGWNQTTVNAEHPIFDELPHQFFGYFVHSFAAPINEFTVGTCRHSRDFASIVTRDNFVGIQFHPERSADAGQQILRGFLSLGSTARV